MQKGKKRWDEIHKKTHKEELVHSTYAEEKEILFPRNCIIADLGGGVGADALYFLEKGHSVVILDISEFALEEAKKRAKKKGLEKNLITKQVDFNLNEIPLKNGSCDIAYARISLNYLTAENTTIIFKEIYRILKKGGEAYLTFRSPDDMQEMKFLKTVATEYEPNVFIHEDQLRSRFTIKQLERMLDAAEIANYEVKPYEEKINEAKKGFQPILKVNELTFKKE